MLKGFTCNTRLALKDIPACTFIDKGSRPSLSLLHHIILVFPMDTVIVRKLFLATGSDVLGHL